jgi:L-ascorbate metabolism protein UlaG (beta-lactamase superfamily)
MTFRFARMLVVLALLTGAAALWLTTQLQHDREALAQLAAQPVLAPVERGAAGLRVRFLGVSTLLFEDDDTALLIDGFFSRPGKLAVFAGRIAPDRERIEQALARAGIERLAAVIVTHSHYDHAMDAPEVARRTGALVVGSNSTANIARGWGLPEDRIRVVRRGGEMDFGRFHVTLVRSHHAPTGVAGGEIDAPLAPPARAGAYREGENYSVLIRHGAHSMLVQGSAGFAEGALRGRRADVVFLGIGALGNQETVYRQAYWRETVHTVGARRVIPIHWDDFTLPLDQPLVPLPGPVDDFDASLRFLLERSRQDGIDLRFAPAWTAIDPFAGLSPAN